MIQKTKRKVFCQGNKFMWVENKEMYVLAVTGYNPSGEGGVVMKLISIKDGNRFSENGFIVHNGLEITKEELDLYTKGAGHTFKFIRRE